MIKWARKVLRWRRERPEDPVVHDYGRYVHKPVIQRAVAMVMGIDQGQLVSLVDKSEVYLNEDKLERTQLVLRLPAGQYEIKIPEQNKVWRFFIG